MGSNPRNRVVIPAVMLRGVHVVMHDAGSPELTGSPGQATSDHDTVRALTGEATAGGDIPNRCSSPLLQLALSAGSGSGKQATSASLQLPLLASGSRQTPSLIGAARGLCPLADVPDALSLGLPAASGRHTEQEDAGSVGISISSAGRTMHHGLDVEFSGEAGRQAAAGECGAQYEEAPQMQTQLGLVEDAADKASPVACGSTPRGAADALSQRPVAEAPASEVGPVMHTQLGVADAGPQSAHAGKGAAAPAVNTQIEAVPPGSSLRLVPDSEDVGSGWQSRHAAPADGPATVSCNREVQSPGPRIAGGDASVNDTNGGSAPRSGVSRAICAMDAPFVDLLQLAPIVETQHGAARPTPCAGAAMAASVAAVPRGSQKEGSGAAVTLASSSLRAARADGLACKVSQAADQPAGACIGSRPALVVHSMGKEERPPADASGSEQVEPAAALCSVGDRTTEVSSSPNRQLCSDAEADHQQLCPTADHSMGTSAQHAGKTDNPMAGTELADALPDRSTPETHAARNGGDQQRPVTTLPWWANGWDAAGSAAAANDAVDGGTAAHVPDSQPVGERRDASVALPSLPHQVQHLVHT